MDNLEKQFYEMFDIEPDSMVMAVMVKALDETTNPENYQMKKVEILSNFIQPVGKALGEYYKDSVQKEWSKLKEDVYKMYQKHVSKN